MATIEDLEKRINDLEKKVNKENTLLFGRSYGEVGTLESDLILKSRGLVKLLFGSKFLDLIKDGKLNTEASFIYQQDKIGTKDGIYIIGAEQKVVLLVNGHEINLNEESSTTYVSFLKPQDTKPEQKYQALLNIGLIVLSVAEINPSVKGIVYVEGENQIYLSDGSTSQPFAVKIPEVIAEKHTFSEGITLDGNSKSEGINLSDLCIYCQNNVPFLDFNNDLYLRYRGNTVGTINKNLSLNGDLRVNSIIGNGFTLSSENGKSYLQVDKIANNTYSPDNLFIGDIYNIISVSDIETNASEFKYTLDSIEGLSENLELKVKLSNGYGTTLIISLNPGGEDYNIVLDGTFDVGTKLVVPSTLITEAGIDAKSIRINSEIDEEIKNSVPTIAWVTSKFALPVGTIVMFNSSEKIPKGWHICDGEEGTPNLIDKFIKAGTALKAGGSKSFTITTDNLPSIEIPKNVIPKYKTASVDKPMTDVNISVLSDTTGGFYTIPASTITNDNTPISFEPEYYSLIFIMKIE